MAEQYHTTVVMWCHSESSVFCKREIIGQHLRPILQGLQKSKVEKSPVLLLLGIWEQLRVWGKIKSPTTPLRHPLTFYLDTHLDIYYRLSRVCLISLIKVNYLNVSSVDSSWQPRDRLQPRRAIQANQPNDSSTDCLHLHPGLDWLNSVGPSFPLQSCLSGKHSRGPRRGRVIMIRTFSVGFLLNPPMHACLYALYR